MTPPPQRWSPYHLRLHQLLLRRPELLPQGASLLVALSGGQDSMALTGLMLDLRRLHHWSLQLWHGDHRWRPESSQQAREIAAWASGQGLEIQLASWEWQSTYQQPPDQQSPDQHQPAQLQPPQEQRQQQPRSEASARAWRYAGLVDCAQQRGCGHVVTGHTASDRAETLLLNLARGSDRRGLASLQEQRPLAEGIQLVRPLLIFSREETARICQALQLPIWLDSSNAELRYSRNRVRSAVLPVLEELHPGATRRIGGTAARMAADLQGELELLDLALQPLSPGPRSLRRQSLIGLEAANQRRLLHHWIARNSGLVLAATVLDKLLSRLANFRGAGQVDLPGDWRFTWNKNILQIHPPTFAISDGKDKITIAGQASSSPPTEVP
jgi:tRNA(Ile)-lysidine synthase